MQVNEKPSRELALYTERINGLILSGYMSPASCRPVLHFIHGTGFCSLTYWPFLKHFTNDFDLFLHDVQGHGESESGERFGGWNRSASNALELMAAKADYFSKRPVFGLAHSFGAAVSLLMAAKAPHRFDGLILMEPVLFSAQQLRMMGLLRLFRLIGQNPMARKARRRTQTWSSKETAWAYLHQRGIFRGWDDASLAAYIEHALIHHEDGRVSLKCPAWLESQLFSTYPAGLWRQVKALNVPTILIRGDRGYTSLAKTANRAAEMNPNINVRTLRGGHCFMQEAPSQAAATVNAMLRNFLNEPAGVA